MKQTKTTKIALVSLLTALSVVLGYFLKIPTPTGILTLLDAGVFFAAFYFGSREGAVVGGLAGYLSNDCHGRGLRLGFYFDEWLGSSTTRNPTKFHAKYGRDDCRIYS